MAGPPGKVQCVCLCVCVCECVDNLCMDYDVSTCIAVCRCAFAVQ